MRVVAAVPPGCCCLVVEEEKKNRGKGGEARDRLGSISGSLQASESVIVLLKNHRPHYLGVEHPVAEGHDADPTRLEHPKDLRKNSLGSLKVLDAVEAQERETLAAHLLLLPPPPPFCPNRQGT